MLREMSADKIRATSDGLEFTFDTPEEAQSLYQECLEKSTDAEIDGCKVTLIIPSRAYRAKHGL